MKNATDWQEKVIAMMDEQNEIIRVATQRRDGLVALLNSSAPVPVIKPQPQMVFRKRRKGRRGRHAFSVTNVVIKALEDLTIKDGQAAPAKAGEITRAVTSKNSEVTSKDVDQALQGLRRAQRVAFYGAPRDYSYVAMKAGAK